MIVDPETGEILQISQPSLDAQSLTGEAGMVGASRMGAAPDGPLMSILANMPTATTSMGWNARRGSNTIMRGGFSGNPNNKGKFLRNHMTPRSFGRMSSVYNIDPTNAPMIDRRFGRAGQRSMYSPLNVLARGGNWIANRVATSNHAALEGLRSRIPSGGQSPYFSPGAVSRISTSAKLARGGRANIGRLMSNVDMLDPTMAPARSRAAVFHGAFSPSEMSNFATKGLSRGNAAHFTGASMNGILSQRASGYMTSLMMGAPSDFAESTLKFAGKEAYLQGAQSATKILASGGLDIVEGGGLRGTRTALRHISAEGVETIGRGALRAGMRHAAGDVLANQGTKMAARTAAAKVAGAGALRTVGLAIPGVNAVMTAWMAYDITKMGMGALTGVADMVKDAGRSFKGSIDKPVMGMGFKDNTVAATSRARGVMAISNSRLNARSVLGSEAGMLASHFG